MKKYIIELKEKGRPDFQTTVTAGSESIAISRAKAEARACGWSNPQARLVVETAA